MNMKITLPILIIVLILSVFISGQNNGSIGANLYSDNMKTYMNVLTLIKENYIQDIGTSELVETSINNMLEQLDPYTQFLNQRDYDDLMIGTRGKYGGLGISIGIRDGVLTVIAPIEDTPAYKAGIIAGDRIVQIEGESTKGITIDEAVKTLRGYPDTKITIGIEREGIDHILDFTITRALIELKSVPYHAILKDGIGYVRITQFSDDTDEELEAALQDLETQGLKALILDLRGNSGGLLNQSVYVSEKFIGSNKIVVSTKGRIRQSNHQFYSRWQVNDRNIPMTVLIDAGTASASEIVTGAIQDWDRGIVVGDTSFGKGSVQALKKMPDGSSIKITVPFSFPRYLINSMNLPE